MPTPRTRFEDMKGRVVRKVDPFGAPRISPAAKERRRQALAARKQAALRRQEKFAARQKELAEQLLHDQRRVVAVCPGLKEKGIHPARTCGRLVKVTLGQGRPWTRCGECRVLDAWRQHFVREDPHSVVKVIIGLAGKGLIGKGPKVG